MNKLGVSGMYDNEAACSVGYIQQYTASARYECCRGTSDGAVFHASACICPISQHP